MKQYRPLQHILQPILLLFLLMGRLNDLNASNKITYFGSYNVKPCLGSWFVTQRC